VRDGVGLAEPRRLERREPRDQRPALLDRSLDRGGVARREPVVVAVIAERRRPCRRPAHPGLPVIGDHLAQRRIADAGDGIGRER
jgi:hypothetical protein